MTLQDATLYHRICGQPAPDLNSLDRANLHQYLLTHSANLRNQYGRVLPNRMVQSDSIKGLTSGANREVHFDALTSENNMPFVNQTSNSYPQSVYTVRGCG